MCFYFLRLLLFAVAVIEPSRMVSLDLMLLCFTSLELFSTDLLALVGTIEGVHPDGERYAPFQAADSEGNLCVLKPIVAGIRENGRRQSYEGYQILTHRSRH